MTPATLLQAGIEDLNLQLTSDACERLLRYAAMLERWNRTYNLTAIRDPKRIMTHHVLDSLSVVPHLGAGPLADVGSGGGLPGLVIAIAEPARPVSVADANSKKAAFLRQAVIELGIRNAQVHEGRAETWRPTERFSRVISRAFADLASFVAATRHLLASGGQWLAMKGALPQAEIAMLPSDVAVLGTEALHVPMLEAERHLVRMAPAAATGGA